MKTIPVSIPVEFKVLTPAEFFDYVQETGTAQAYRLYNTSIEEVKEETLIRVFTNPINFPHHYHAFKKGSTPIIVWELHPVTYSSTREQFTKECKRIDRPLNNASKDIFVIRPKI